MRHYFRSRYPMCNKVLMLLLTSAVMQVQAQAPGQAPGTAPRAPAPALPGFSNTAQAPALLSRIEDLGRQIFADRNLSEPRGTSCLECHAPAQGFAGNNGSRLGVSIGSRPSSLGGRNGMSNAYTAFVPPFSFRVKDGDVDPVGGLFWDGRAQTPAQQALGPFLNPLEMNNADAAAVVRKIAAAPYAQQFRDIYGVNILRSPDLAFAKVGEAIAAYEKTTSLQAFTSKYDQFIKGQTPLSSSEANGMKIFMDPARGNCASCHTMNPKSPDPRDSMFSDYAFYNLGIPRNREIPRNANPSFFDLGICGPDRARPALTDNVPTTITTDNFCGAFRMVSLRNVAERTAFMHNGFFKNLRDVVAFYATRNTDPKRWYGPAGVPNDIPVAYRANVIGDRIPFNRPAAAGPALSEREIDDVVSFLRTLSDSPDRGPVPPPAAPSAGINPFGR